MKYELIPTTIDYFVIDPNARMVLVYMEKGSTLVHADLIKYDSASKLLMYADSTSQDCWERWIDIPTYKQSTYHNVISLQLIKEITE